jgi:DNA-binding protein H-NS
MARSVDIGELSGEDLMGVLEMACDRLSVPDLLRLQDIAERKREEKLEDAKQQVIEELKEKLSQMGVLPNEVSVSFGPARRDTGATLRAKYRGPSGETWSGRGFVPNWLRTLEEQGRSREEFLVTSEGE